MHVVMRQNFVPGISFHAKLEVAVPDVATNPVANLKCRHVTVKFLAADDGMLQCREEFARSLCYFTNRVNKSLIIARLMTFDWGLERCQLVGGTVVGLKYDLYSHARSLFGL